MVPPPSRRPPRGTPTPAEVVRDALAMLRLDGRRAHAAVQRTLEWLNRVGSARELLADVDRAPVRRPVRGRPAPFPRGAQGRRLAAALLQAGDSLGGAFTDIHQVAAVPGVDAEVLAVLVLVAGALEAPAPAPEVGVLLPMRLETRFVEPPAGGGWTLLVRVVPDAASLDRHHPLPSAGELDAVERLWNDTGTDLTTDDGRAQWGRFAAAVGGAGRAAWLARSFPAVPDGGGGWRVERPAELRGDLVTSRVAGLPATMELWLGRGGAAPARVATLTVDPDRLTLEMPDPDSADARWWSSFDEATKAGLATKVDLGPVRPDDLDVLMVVGLGDGDPAAVFGAHRDAGVLGVLSLGVPTNTVAGAPAADLARDPETWRQLLVAPGAQQGAQEVSLALTGSSTALLPLPGGDPSDVDVNQALVAALWSAVWGHGLKDVWDLDDGFALGLWAVENLVPEGPVPPVRVGDQPYGVLPVTSLARWTPAAGDPPLEDPLRKVLTAARASAAAAAEADGTTAGATTERLLDLIGRVPTSRGFAWRWQVPLELLQGLWWAYGSGVTWGDLARSWDDRARPVLELGAPPARRYVTLGWAQDLQIPLVEADNSPLTFEEAVNRILSFPPNVLASEDRRQELFHPWPDSLLLRLLVHAVAVNAAEVARAHEGGDKGPLLDPIAVSSNQPTRLYQWGTAFDDGQLADNEQSQLFEVARDAAARLAVEPVPVLERVLRATLDTASHRVDPWVTGMAWRRLRSLTSGPTPAKFRLGVYGWVDAPRPRAPGGQPDEYLHAPSEAQAMTSALLRDRAVRDADPGRWQVDLDSDGVRAAEQLAAEVRLGAHLSEALGRAVERAIGVRDDVERLRRELPIRTEHEGRRVCDGLAVVQRFHDAPASLGLTAAQLAAVAPLADALDTYGDLLVADAVFDVVSGRTALAAQAMEAAAGLDAPPGLDVLRTPRSGQSVSSTVVTALPAVPGPAAVDATTSPGLLAEPAVAAYLVSVTGPTSGGAWTWQVHDENGAPAGAVTLSDLGLLPVDTLALSAQDLADAVIVHAGAAGVSSEAAGPSTCRRLAHLLGSRPVVPADLVDDSSQPPDSAVHVELLGRYAAVHALGTDLQLGLVAAATAGETEQLARLRDALRWGVTPLTADEPTPSTSLARATTALADRLDRSPTPAEAAAQSVPVLARSLAELVSPEGGLPVLSRLPLDQLPVTLTPEPPGAGEAVDPDWLEVVATVRSAVARLDAEQLRRRVAGETPLASWSSRPGDPWQADLGHNPAPEGLRASTRLVAAFGPDGALDAAAGDPARLVALGLVDSWSEVVPGTEHSTHVAFHYDAPGARAPQAILVAVPPVVDQPLDGAGLVDVVLETRELARARMAVPAVLDHWSAAAPTAVLPVHDPGVDLRRSP